MYCNFVFPEDIERPFPNAQSGYKEEDENEMDEANFKEDNYRKIALLFFAILIFFNPLFPSHNFYNSWVNNIISIIFVFFLIIHSKKINA